MQHPRTASKASGRKGKAVVPSEDEQKDEEQEEEDRAGARTLQGAQDNNVVSLNDDEEDIPTGGNKLPLSRAQLTSPIIDVEALVWRKNVIAPRTLFVEEPIVEATKLPSSGPAVETRMAKRARQSRAGSVAGPSSPTIGDYLQSFRIHHLEERMKKRR